MTERRWRVTILALIIMGLETAVAQEWVIGVEAHEFLPYADGRGVEYGGFAREVFDAFAADSGTTVRYRPLPIKRLYSELLAGRIDAKFPDNALWNTEGKDGFRVIYSQPLVHATEGVLVRPDRLGQPVVHLGTVLGFTPWPLLDVIRSGNMQVSEVTDFSQLVSMIQYARIDGIYFNIEVAAYRLDPTRQDVTLLLDRSLPVVTSGFHLSSVSCPELIERFDAWMKLNARHLEALRAQHGLSH